MFLPKYKENVKRIGKSIQIFDTKVPQIQRTMLITILAEASMLRPSVLLSDFVTYEEISETQVKAIIRHNGVEGEGIFTYDDSCHEIQFESNQRQGDEEYNGKIVNVGWRCIGSNFKEINGMKKAQKAQAIKVYPDKEVIYFDSDNIIKR